MEKGETGSSAAIQTEPLKRVLNAGSGSYNARHLHPVFARETWQEIRIDIDPRAKPDLICSITEMDFIFAPGSFDAIWSSHTLEHLYTHEVPSALAQFKRVLKPNGFALITSPDLEAVAPLILDRGLDQVAYTSPAGHITPLDMLFGHSASIAGGIRPWPTGPDLPVPRLAVALSMLVSRLSLLNRRASIFGRLLSCKRPIKKAFSAN